MTCIQAREGLLMVVVCFQQHSVIMSALLFVSLCRCNN